MVDIGMMKFKCLTSEYSSIFSIKDKNSKLISVLTIFTTIIACPTIAKGSVENYFNPAFLSNDPNSVADLESFQENKQAPGDYRVDVYVNESYISTKNIKFVKASEESTIDNETGLEKNKVNEVNSVQTQDDDTGLSACITAGYLSDLGVDLTKHPDLAKKNSNDCVNLQKHISQSHVRFDFENMKLYISIPQADLHRSARGYIPSTLWDQGIPALLMNYNFSGNNSAGNNNNSNYFLSLGSGINAGAWRLKDLSNWSYYSGYGESASKWQHISTSVERDVIPLKSQLVLGESYTTGDIFDSLPFKGVQLSSDDNMLPDSLKGFAPTIRGIAKSNAQVTISQNGYDIYQTYVSPGAFNITDLFPTSSSGDLNVTVKEADGSVNSYTVPYSAVPLLQREGRLKFSLTAAKYRSGNSYQEQPEFMQATAILGLKNGFTLYGGTQYSNDYDAYSLGVGKNMGMLGAVSADITHADSTLTDGSHHKGQSVRFLFSKSLNNLGTNFQLLGYRYSTEGFYTLDETAYKMMKGYNLGSEDEKKELGYRNYYNLYHTKKDKLQVNISQQLDDLGAIFVSGSKQSFWHTDETNMLLQAGYSRIFTYVNASVTYNYNKASGRNNTDQVVAINLSIPISRLLNQDNRSSSTAYATYNNSIDMDGNANQLFGVSGSLLQKKNMNYSLQQGLRNHGDDPNYGSASVNYQGTYGNSNASYNYSKNFHQVNYGLAGGIVMHQNGITLSQPLGDTNVLIKAAGADDVAVENTTGVTTDWRGYAVIPYATAYRENRIALDTTTLNNFTDIDDAVDSVVPTKGALVRANFKARVGVRALLELTRGNSLVPFGSTVSVFDNDNASIVGDNGQVYMSGLPLEGKLKVKWGEGPHAQCVASYKLPEDSIKKLIVRAKVKCI